MSKTIFWNMPETRTSHPFVEQEGCLELYRPCSCGCDRRDGDHGVGYLKANDADGNGVTIWGESEEAFRILESAMDFKAGS